MSSFKTEIEEVAQIESARVTGAVRQVIGLVIECEGLSVPVGSLCDILRAGGDPLRAEVVGFRGDVTLLMPLGELEGIRRGDFVQCHTTVQRIAVGDGLLGRVVDAWGRPIDGGPPLYALRWAPLYQRAPHPLERSRITEPLTTGIRSMDAVVTCGKGQRVGLFSGSGVGKSVLMGMIARNTGADISVIALVGERGREVKEFLERDLGPDGLKRSVVVVETGERPPLLRIKAPFAATAIAEYFRDEGRDVMLLMDSITRMANAQREIGLSTGEPPATKGYPPSVFTQMPKLLERAGCGEKGSITGIYTVLVESDDMNEPISDTARSILDGHVWLSRNLAIRGHYPAIDPLSSISRVMVDVVSEAHAVAANRLKACLAIYRDHEDLINIGAYVKGSNPEIDTAIRVHSAIHTFLRQGIRERSTFEETVNALLALAKEM